MRNIRFVNFHGDSEFAPALKGDFDVIEVLLSQGKTPSQIIDLNPSYRRYEGMIRRAFFDNRRKETPVKRDVSVFWHCIPSKFCVAYQYSKLCKKYGKEEVFLLNDYSDGCFNNYNGQRVLILPCFNGQVSFLLLKQWLEGYMLHLHSTLPNAYSLWSEVHILTFTPLEFAQEVFSWYGTSGYTYDLLKSLITAVVFHYKDRESGYFFPFETPIQDYVSYSALKSHIESILDTPFSPTEEFLISHSIE